MKYEYADELITSYEKLGQDLNRIFTSLLNQNLAIEGHPVLIPNDTDLEIKAKFKETPEDDSFTLEISWEKPYSEDNNEDD